MVFVDVQDRIGACRLPLRVPGFNVVGSGTSGTVVEKFGAQPTAPLKDVRYIPEPTEP